MGQLAIVNAPSSFTFIWSMIKPWLSKETVEKVDILGSDYKDVLLDLVDKESLPSVLGGECTCAGDGGCQLSGSGPWKEGRVGWGPKAAAADGSEAGSEATTVAEQMSAGKLGAPSGVRGDEEQDAEAQQDHAPKAHEASRDDAPEPPAEKLAQDEGALFVQEHAANGVAVGS